MQDHKSSAEKPLLTPQAKTVREEKVTVRMHRKHPSARLLATIAAAVVCSFVAIVLVGIIQQPAPEGGGTPIAGSGAEQGNATSTALLAGQTAEAALPTPTQSLINELLPPLTGEGPNTTETPGHTRYYTETGHTVAGDFLDFYNSVPYSTTLFGLPLTDAFTQQMPDGSSLKVQYFERARLEYHPDAVPPIVIGALGTEIVKGRSFDPVSEPPDDGATLYFTETEHTLAGGFLDYWQTHGGLPVFGYPLSEEIPEDGLTVQYFERARMEYHADLVGTGYGVQLSPIGFLDLQTQLADIPAATLVSFNPPEVAEGHTAEIDVNASTGVTVTGSYEGRPLLFSYDRARGVAWSLIGAVPFEDLGEHQVTVDVAQSSGEGQTVRRNLNVVSYPFPSEDLQFDPLTAQLTAAGVVTAEDVALSAIFSVRTPKQYWSGRFQMPLDGPIWITSDFATRRCYSCPEGAPPTTYHSGVDMAANVGTPVYAAADGVVVFAGMLADRGNAVIIDHGLGVYTLYAHNSRFLVKQGQFVHQGDTISLSGNTGLSNGPHVHWEMHVNGPPVDAQEWVKRIFP